MKRGTFLKAMLGLPLGIGPLVAQKLRRSKDQRYLLNKFYVAGFQYHAGPSVINRIKKSESLTLVSKPQNAYDSFAVALYRKDMMLGYVPRSDNKHVSRLLRQGVDLHCHVQEVNPDRETWKMLKVDICL